VNLQILLNLPVILPSLAAICLGVAALGLFIEEQKLKKERVSKKDFETISIHEQIAQNVLENLADGIIMIDGVNELPFVNASAKKILRIKANKPKLADIVNSLPPIFDLKKMVEQTLTENKALEEQEIKLEEKTLKVNLAPIILRHSGDERSEESRISLVCLVIKDVTFDNSLSIVKDDFVNMMIHELRAPITAVKGASKILVTNKKLSREEREKMLTLIHDQSKRILDQISSLLDLAKIQASKFTIQKTPSDIKKLIEQVVEVFSVQAKNKKIELLAKIDKSVPKEVMLDPIRIGQVLNNLISNSVKFTQEKGKITVSAQLIQSGTKKLTVSVADTGIGIPKEQQGELFSKFYQIDSGKNAGEIKNHVAGTGLGLFISKQIIDAHGGIITLDSEPGKGTTITFSIPI